MIALAILLATAAVATNVPRLEDCRVVYVHEICTSVLNAPDGTVCIDQEPRPYHDECRARYAKREMPFPYRRLRDYVNTNECLPPSLTLDTVDRAGRAWYFWSVQANRQLVWYESAAGQLRRHAFDGYYMTDQYTFPDTKGVARELFHDVDGAVWLTGMDRLYRLHQGTTTSVMLPVPENSEQATDFLGKRPDPCWHHQYRRIGDSLWMVRVVAANCHREGSYVVRVRNQQAELAAWIPGEFVSGLLQHRDGVAAFVEQSVKVAGRYQCRPKRLVPVVHELHPEILQRYIADLDGDWPAREAASRFLLAGPSSSIGALREAQKSPKSLEQKLRLEELIGALANASNRPPFQLEGLAAGRLLFLDRQGRQYVQAWTNGPTRTCIIFDPDKTVTVELPAADFTFDSQGDDGRLYGHDAKCAYALDPRQPAAPRPILALPAGPCAVVATWRGWLCVRWQTGDHSRLLWIDPRTTPQGPELTGQELTDGLAAPFPNGWHHHFPVATGTDGTLWFIRGTNALCRAAGPKISELAGDLPLTGKWSVWPLAADTAVLAKLDGSGQANRAVFYDSGGTAVFPSVAALAEARRATLTARMADGLAFVTGDEDDERLSLLRMGDTLAVEDRTATTLLRAGQEPQPLRIKRWAGLDVKSQRVFGFDVECKVLKSFPFTATAGEELELARFGGSWAWNWRNQTGRPRYSGTWTLTPVAAERLLVLEPARTETSRQRGEWETRYDSADFTAFRRWQDGQWRELPVSLYGSEPWEDGAGNVWLFRVREAEVLFADGRRQLIPLDAGYVDNYRLAIESPDAVWVASQESLTRFRLERDKDKRPSRWVKDRVFRLPAFGLGFAGPWIAGQHLYYGSAGKLFHLPLSTGQTMEVSQ